MEHNKKLLTMWNALQAIRKHASSAWAKIDSPGLSDAVIKQFEHDSFLKAAVNMAADKHKALQKHPNLRGILKIDEKEAVDRMQKGYLNFYDSDAVQPYVALAASGPWIVTATGAVVYDTGGYGMLGFGHNPKGPMAAMSDPQVMANIMTPSFMHATFMDSIRSEIGHSRSFEDPNGKAAAQFNDTCPYDGFVCLNSGSECVSLAMRIMDVDARQMTSTSVPTAPHPGRESVLVSLKGSFHGRTDRPAQASDSCQTAYKKYLASFRNKSETLYTVEPNNVGQLKEVFEEIDDQNLHVEAMLMEPVMGEGNPGVAIEREFYDEARRLTDEYRSLLLVDSIQAGFRATGCLSIMDYPGFQSAEPPDFETFSKSINAGQYPLSVLALGPRVPEIYVQGLYGNTMTTNPRALSVACAVLNEWEPALRENVRNSGLYFKNALKDLADRNPDAICDVTGTGLLIAAHLNEEWKVLGGPNSVERLCRRAGLNVIHGGANALRFTPWFRLSETEVDMMVEILHDVFQQYRDLEAANASS